ncbi:TetR/AcrR family transcriptional regulator [Enterobacter sichuanensis]|uniref:TetR/AcrR family transcriptional regulator n=1 Tax=Enterobacter sichuanensis TaxID=2071710 RepID=UPI0012A96281|nr:TetR/AcrR family transcriptional regulator [Enterobacter sichuanensis]QFQ07997.1 TetR/AcrR family transcriptional regulator [Enterobacter sichuanensis]
MDKRALKRQQILEVASGLFRQKGFDATSISEINAIVGGSKSTIYSHFSSKEELFVECMSSETEQYIKSMTIETAGQVRLFGKSPQLVIEQFAVAFLRYICSPDIVDLQRLMISEAGRSGIGELYYARMQKLRSNVSALFTDLMNQNILRKDDPVLAAEYFRSLLQADILEPLLLKARKDQPDESEIVRKAQASVNAFMKLYGPEKNEGVASTSF